MLRLLFLTVIIFSSVELSTAQIRATTESGNKVLLFDNGTWKYEEKTADMAESAELNSSVPAVSAIVVDSARTLATEPQVLFYLPSRRLVKYFGEKGGLIQCKVSCSNSFGTIKIHFLWELPVKDGDRYFGSFKQGSMVTLTMDDGQTVELIMGDESNIKRVDKNNFSVISNTSQPLSKAQLAVLCAQPARKIEVEWNNNPEEYDLGKSHLFSEMLPTVF